MSPKISDRTVYCIVCGRQDLEVQNMYCFPSNKAKAQLWLEKMGIKHTEGSLRGYRICNLHFTRECFANTVTAKLNRNAIPTMLPAKPSLGCQAGPSGSQEMPLTEEPEGSTSTGVQYTEANIDKVYPSCSHTSVEVASAASVTAQSFPPESTKPQKSLFRGISDIEKTPRKVALMSKIMSKEAQIRRLRTLARERKDDLKALSDLTDSSVVRNLFDGMPRTTTDFLISQMRCAKRAPRGRRWTLEEKVFALALFKRSPRGYNFLRKVVALPAKSTILALLDQVPLAPGINVHLFEHIKQCIVHNRDRYVALLFDEIDIKEHLEYDKKRDAVVGFEDFGPTIGTTTRVANKALTFMVCGLGDKKWKQPVAYYFSKDGCSSDIMKQTILEVLEACMDIAGLHVVTTICDMGTTNVKAITDLGVTMENPYFWTKQGNKVFSMFDSPHLLKRIASLFRQYDVSLPVDVGKEKTRMTAKFEDIRKIYKKDKESPLIFRALHKISEAHLAPKIKFSMKVNIAAQIMSHTVAASLYSYISHNELPQRALATATFVHQVNDIFDSVNGSRLTQASDGGNKLRCCVTAESGHVEFWEQALTHVRSWEFQRRTKTGLLKKMPPSQKGWITTLTAMKGIWEYLQSQGFTSLRTRALNQDPLENLFGAVRSGCGGADNPTIPQFIGSLKTQIINGLSTRTIGGNCEEDEALLLSNLLSFVHHETSKADRETGTAPLPEISTPAEILPNVAEAIADAVLTGQTATLSVAYVAGYILKYILPQIATCNVCLGVMRGTPEDPQNLLISNKEFSTDSQHLNYPSVPLVTAVGLCVTTIEATLDKCTTWQGIAKLLKRKLDETVSLPVDCEVHTNYIKNTLLESVIHIAIPWWCKRQNAARKHAIAKSSQRRKIKKFQHL